MSIISIRLNKEEMMILENAAQLYGNGISSMMKNIVFEKLEDDFNLQLIKNYETNKNVSATRDIQDLAKEIGLDWDEL